MGKKFGVIMNPGPVPPDIFLSPEVVKSCLAHQFDLQVKEMIVLGEGWDNTVFLVNSHLVFRFPRRKVAVPLIEREMRLLPRLGTLLPLPIPNPQYLGNWEKKSDQFPFSFFGHEVISGRTGCKVTLSRKDFRRAAQDLGKFLGRLHGIGISDLGGGPGDEDGNLTPFFDRLDFLKMQENFQLRLKSLEKVFPLKNYESKIRKVLEGAAGYDAKKGRNGLVHGDLYHRHLLFDDSNILCGVIDWGDICISKPVVDLGVVYQFFPPEVHEEFWKSYGVVSDETKNYAKFLGLYYAVTLAWYGSYGASSDESLVKGFLQTMEYEWG